MPQTKQPAPSRPTPPFCLTIAGLDPSGGAGATADLRVFRRVGVYGLSAFTALTPQNTRGVIGIHPVSKQALEEELEAVRADFPLAALKTGQIPNREIGAGYRRFHGNDPGPSGHRPGDAADARTLVGGKRGGDGITRAAAAPGRPHHPEPGRGRVFSRPRDRGSRPQWNAPHENWCRA